jgi:hypothetical protein
MTEDEKQDLIWTIDNLVSLSIRALSSHGKVSVRKLKKVIRDIPTEKDKK